MTMPVTPDISEQPRIDDIDYSAEQILDNNLPIRLDQQVFTGSVLVAEDTKTNQTLIRLLLEKAGLQVTIVENGKQAAEKALDGNFDLILMDMQMPVMNGYDATKKLRQQGFMTPIVALTANAMQGDDKKCFDVGCNDYIPKPIDRQKLLQILNKYLFNQNFSSLKSTDLAV